MHYGNALHSPVPELVLTSRLARAIGAAMAASIATAMRRRAAKRISDRSGLGGVLTRDLMMFYRLLSPPQTLSTYIQ